MMRWMIPVIWGFCRFLGNALTTVGLAGLLYMAGWGLTRACDRLLEE